MRVSKQKRFGLLLIAALLVFVPSVAYAQQTSTSNNYQVEQTFFGSGGELNACSGAYCAKQTAGELGVGESSSDNYRAFAGFNTTDDPYLEFVVTGNNIDLNYLDVANTKTANGTFAVRAWQAGGYVVQTQSNPPYNPEGGGHYMSAMTTAGDPTPGTEQFGINLVANTSPTNFGSGPQQIPDGTFSFGEVEPEYAVANKFKYNKGDIVARSRQSTSITVYTVSYIFDISTITPSGQYKFVHDLVATATY